MKQAITGSFFKCFLLCIIISITSQINAQQLTHVQGQFIVQLDADISAKNWINNFNAENDYNIRLNKKVSPVLNIYTVNYDFTKHVESRVHTALLLHDNVEIAQYNHFVKLRETIPNDPQFTNQWQYINVGQDGGTPGADIDMELAWDYATGGITAAGDTIVACIIDDGVDNTHLDIAPNLFINYQEIPGNGIDDDNNGFVDDYRGWDTGSDTDEVYDGGGHGTPVTGIIGARGNDEFGVAGVNWNVKLMIVQGGTGVESEVLEAYSYPLSFRKKYNETNGAEGAFVVSTNASWGIDFGQPADAPLWCAFYDTLGQAGIISCGATINGNQNVDEIGDLPTACPSDFLISVTNMNRNDEKVNGAGYGAVTIDLGAFGAETWTTRSGGGFGGFGGTSGATPHVTGAAALLYSLPCSNLIALAKSDPGSAATLVRTAILESVDPNESLENITTTGGRLNVKNAMEFLLQNHCGDCLAPFVDETTILENNDTQITFSLNDTTEFVEMRYRILGSTDWIDGGLIASPYTFENLDLCVEYEYQLRAICTNSEGEYGITQSFTSFGCCINPNLPEAIEIGDDFVHLTWPQILAATSYNLRYRVIGASTWEMATSESNTMVLGGLNSCSNYEVQIQSDCFLDSPEYSTSIFFFTVGCADPCVQLPYCGIEGYNASEEWLSFVKIANLESVSESDQGYGNFTNVGPTTDLLIGGQYKITISPGYQNNTFEEYVIVWIDFDQNGVFDEMEIVVNQGPIDFEIEETFNIPVDSKAGNTRMRVAMRYDTDPSNCTEENFNDFGEVEDYCVSLLNSACIENQTIDTVMITANQATIQWDEDLNTDSYQYRYKLVSATTWNEESTSEELVILSNLEACKDYEFQLKSICSNSESDYGTSLEFKTSCLINTENNTYSSIDVFPVPTRNLLTIHLNNFNFTSEITISVINQVGEIVYTKSSQVTENTIDIGDLASGMYYLQIQDENSIILNKKIVKL